jgi:hypothetical protein
MDVTFAVAKDLSLDVAFMAPFDSNLTTCFNLPMTNRTYIPSCSQWSDATILQSHVTYAGYCPELDRPAPHKQNLQYKDIIFKFTHNM